MNRLLSISLCLRLLFIKRLLSWVDLTAGYSASDPLTINVGFIYEPNYDPVTGLVTLAIAETDLRTAQVIPDWINFTYVQMFGCELQTGVGPAVQLRYKNDSDVLIGPACDSASVLVAQLSTFWNILVVNYAGSNDGVTQTRTYTRTSFPNSKITKAIVNLMPHYGWWNVGIIRSSDSSCDLFTAALETDMANFNDDLNVYLNVSNAGKVSLDFNNLDTSTVDYSLAYIRLKARIFVICPGSDIHSAWPLLIKLEQQNMTTAEYFYIMPWLQKDVTITKDPWVGPTNDDIQDRIVFNVYKRIMVVDQEGGSGTTSKFLTQLQDTMAAPPWNHAVTSLNASVFIRNLHDAFYLYGLSLNKSLKAGVDFRDGGGMALNIIANTTFSGASGQVMIDQFGDREPLFTVLAMDEKGNYSPVFRMNLLPPDNYGWRMLNISMIRADFWYTKDNTVPKDNPECGFSGLNCPLSTKTVEIAAPVAVAAVLLLSVALVVYYRIRSLTKQRMLLKMTWKVEKHEIHKISKALRKGDDSSSGSMPSASQVSTSNMSTDTGSTLSSGHVGGFEEHGMLLYKRCPFIGVGDYRDTKVAVKQIRQYISNVNFDMKELTQLHTIKEVRHENLNIFIGLVTNATPGYVLWAYCHRGSLEDVLYDDHIELDIMFKSSLMRDLLRGLEYLHKSPIGVHGSLTTTNCVIDSRWVLKITDFGLHEILNQLQNTSKSLNEVDDHLYNQTMYHMSPELLRQAFEKKQTTPTKEADIYSLSVVLFQILFREQPFTNMTITPAEIIRKIAYPGPSYQILRPTQPKRSGLNHGFTVFLNLCWDESPQSRPNIVSAKESIYALTKQYNANIIDHVINLMEQYTTNLEKVAEERTKELEAERTRADLLLKEMLPKTVVEELKAGRTVPPEQYESATIYFSDIVQFSQLCAISSPIEIVNMLNVLYNGYDNIVKQYDVYKVETIGDAYMVASGLPLRNEMRHVTEIADMALHILRFVRLEFKVSHRPNEKLEVRIGIHTGPAAAGVIGLAMPRYCVFGDTVNTASRMESTGQAMKIQVSAQTANVLNMQRAYIMESRGMIEVKGKGVVETFWLIDKIPVADHVK